MVGWKITFRHDQCEFILAALDYIIARANQRIDNGKYEPFDQFAALRTKERAVEIQEDIRSVIE